MAIVPIQNFNLRILFCINCSLCSEWHIPEASKKKWRPEIQIYLLSYYHK